MYPGLEQLLEGIHTFYVHSLYYVTYIYVYMIYIDSYIHIHYLETEYFIFEMK